MPRVMNKAIWPHQVTMEYLDEDPDPRQDWLEEKLPKKNWYIKDGMYEGTYCFKDEKEFLHFLLIWQ
jgi:hypothetical protein